MIKLEKEDKEFIKKISKKTRGLKISKWEFEKQLNIYGQTGVRCLTIYLEDKQENQIKQILEGLKGYEVLHKEENGYLKIVICELCI